MNNGIELKNRIKKQIESIRNNSDIYELFKNLNYPKENIFDPSYIKKKRDFAFLENKVADKLVKKIEKAGGKVEEFTNASEVAGKKPEFNLFALCDALGNRDRKQLWILSQQALFAGVTAEEIFWKLVWQTKMILLVAKSPGKQLKTVKPFVAGKSARFARQYSLTELEKLSGDLVALWHETKRENGPDFALGLERLILSI